MLSLDFVTFLLHTSCEKHVFISFLFFNFFLTTMINILKLSLQNPMASSPPAPGDGSGGGSPPPTCKSFRETKSWKEDPGGGAGSLQLPYKIVSKLMKYHQEALAELEEIELEKHWNHHINNLKRLNLFQSSLAVCDVRELDPGDSRHGRHVGIALSLLIAALCKPPFHGYVF